MIAYIKATKSQDKEKKSDKNNKRLLRPKLNVDQFLKKLRTESKEHQLECNLSQLTCISPEKMWETSSVRKTNK